MSTTKELWSDWDAQIEADLSSGKLDYFINQARAEIMLIDPMYESFAPHDVNSSGPSYKS